MSRLGHGTITSRVNKALLQVKVKLSFHLIQLYAVKACVVWISRGITPLIPNLGNKWRWWELATSRPGHHVWSPPPSPPELKTGWWSWLVRSRSFGEDKRHLLLTTNPDSVVVQPVTYLHFWYNNVNWNVIVRLWSRQFLVTHSRSDMGRHQVSLRASSVVYYARE